MTIDQVVPGPKWEFDSAVTDAFDDMLARSIPQYDVMRKIITDLAVAHLPADSALLDLGSSRGEAIAGVAVRVPDTVVFAGIEVSEPMVAAARSRFITDPRVTIYQHDLRDGLPSDLRPGTWQVVTSVLTLMFTPIEYRSMLLAEVYNLLTPGGVFLFVEKVVCSNGRVERAIRDLYRDHKRAMGYTDEAIIRKAASLEGVLVPLTAAGNEELLRGAGFGVVECVWRWGPFAGWAAWKQ